MNDLKTWLQGRYEPTELPPLAHTIARQFLRESERPCDPASIKAVLEDFWKLGLVLGKTNYSGARLRLRRVKNV